MIAIHYSREFERRAKELARKYSSFVDDLVRFQEDLLQNPTQGADLGNGLRKVRFAIKSKGKGKSGGARVITMTIVVNAELTDITLLTIYDKSRQSTISKKDIQALLLLYQKM